MMMYVDPGSIEKYLNVFKLIFDNMGHLNHYNMMMKIQRTESASEKTNGGTPCATTLIS
jgi:hypothetical protein